MNVNSSQIDLNEDLDKINSWAYQWKMSFNPDPSKKAQEVIFSRKVNNVLQPPLTFNNVDMGQISFQKHLGMFLDFKVSTSIYKRFLQKSTEVLLYFANFKLCCLETLLTIYKLFIGPNFDYGDVIYDQSYNDSFHAKLEHYQYKQP